MNQAHFWVGAALLALPACAPASGTSNGAGGGGGDGNADAGGEGGASGSAAAEVQLGVPGGSDGLSFEPLDNGAELRLETFGQGGVHVLLGVRCIGFGSRAFVSVTLKNQNSGTELVAPAPARPQLLFCEGENCDLVPITVMAGGLTQSAAERDGLPIEISAEVHNQAGVSGTADRTAVLSTADL
ncbi:MAG: hypothetical protein ABI488_14050 [Polyangiaceae bacterium]